MDRTSRRLVRRGAIRPPRRFCGPRSGDALGPAASDVFPGLRLMELPHGAIPVRVAGLQLPGARPAHRRPGDMARARSDLPDNIPAHTKTQKLYFDDAFMLKRWDYETDVLGGVAAHYCYDPVTVEGIVFPTLRRVVRRTPDGPLLSGRTSFVLDYTNVEVRT